MIEFKKAVFSVDCQNVAPALVEKAIHVVKSLGCTVKILDNVRNLSWFARATLPNHEEISSLVEKDKLASIKGVVDQFLNEGIDAEGELLHGTTSSSVLKYCENNSVDLIIRGTKGVHSRETGHLGRTSKQLLRGSKCAIWLMHQQTKPVSENIVACIDTESDDPDDLELSDRIIQTAEFLKNKGHGVISVVHAWELWNEKMVRTRITPEEFEQWKQDCQSAEKERFNEFLGRHSRSAEDRDVFMVEGDPSKSIPDFAHRVSADVVVMGTVGRTGFTGLLIGNSAERIFERVDCDVLALKHIV